MTHHLGTASGKHLHPLIAATRRSFAGLPYSKLLPDVLSQISVVEMFVQSKLGRESCLGVLDKRGGLGHGSQCTHLALIPVTMFTQPIVGQKM